MTKKKATAYSTRNESEDFSHWFLKYQYSWWGDRSRGVFKVLQLKMDLSNLCQIWKGGRLRSLPCIALRILTAQNFTHDKRVRACAHTQNSGFFLCGLVCERSKLSLSRNRVWWPINFFWYFRCSHQILSVKWKQINTYVWKINYR